MKIIRRFLPALILPAILLGLVFTFPTLLMDYLVDPITRMVWLTVRGFWMIDQKIYWGLLVFAVMVLVLRIIPTQPEDGHASAYADLPLPEDRLDYWGRLIRTAEIDADGRASLQHNLEDLQDTLDPLVEGDGQKTTIRLPSHPDPLRRVLASGKRVVRSQQGGHPKKIKSDLEKSISHLLDSMESSLEINHDETRTDHHDR